MSPQPGLTVMAANLWHDWPRQHRWIGRLEAVAGAISVRCAATGSMPAMSMARPAITRTIER